MAWLAVLIGLRPRPTGRWPARRSERAARLWLPGGRPGAAARQRARARRLAARRGHAAASGRAWPGAGIAPCCIQTQSERGGKRHDLVLEYQVFLSPATVRTIEIAPMRLRFDGAGRSEELLVEAWPVTVAPLAPVVVSPRRGLGELQPDRDPPLIDTAMRQLRLIGCAAGAALLLGWLAVAAPRATLAGSAQPTVWPCLARTATVAGRPARAQWRGAVRLFHEALNRSAGEVLFEPGLERFLAGRPAFHRRARRPGSFHAPFARRVLCRWHRAQVATLPGWSSWAGAAAMPNEAWFDNPVRFALRCTGCAAGEASDEF